MACHTTQSCTCNPCRCETCRCGEDTRGTEARTENQPARCSCGTSYRCGDRCDCAPA